VGKSLRVLQEHLTGQKKLYSITYNRITSKKYLVYNTGDELPALLSGRAEGLGIG
jgi:hypothetical protein